MREFQTFLKKHTTCYNCEHVTKKLSRCYSFYFQTSLVSMRCSPLLLKARHPSCLNNWGLLKGPGFRLISPESRSNKGQNELSFLNLNLDITKMHSSLWKCELLTSFVILMVPWVKNWKNWRVKQDFNLLWGFENL